MNILTQRVTRPTGGTAIDAGCLDGKDKLVIGINIAGQHSQPALFIGIQGQVFHHRLLLQAYSYNA
ncbi:hypothetical protein D3C76_1119120 [compost metagenome]